jgi:hypothetical protein
VDAVSYGISVVTSRRIRGDFASQSDVELQRGLWAEALDGLKHLWRNPILRAVLIQAPLINFAVSGAIFTVILGLRKNGTSAVVIGVAEAVIMTGGLVGAVLAPQIRSRVSVRQALLLLTGAGTLAMLAAAAIMPSPAVALPLALPLVLSPATNAALFALMLRGTPPNMHGRVTNSIMQVATALAALAPLASGLVVERASASWAMVFFAASLAVVVPLAFLFPATSAEESDQTV